MLFFNADKLSLVLRVEKANQIIMFSKDVDERLLNKTIPC